jgi:hypothetical protein
MDIDMNKLLISLSLMCGDGPGKSLFVKNFIADNSIIKWGILFIIISKKDEKTIYYFIIFFIYQLLYILDSIYFIK